MTKERDEQLERMQSQALKLIFGRRLPYAERRQRTDVTTLRDRGVELCNKFAGKNLSGRFAHWFPLRDPGHCRSGRNAPEKYLETFARCDRLRHSPLFYMRCRLNGKPGQILGVRNLIQAR